jgi:hypothetical protein
MVEGHHSFMSASDAAPLPRLGEVFFDVRGSSRSMRLSWYADTGVAVFSIWQGGMCTGTFRLPIGDLPRMVEILQRGPDGRAPAAGEHGASRDYPTGSVLAAAGEGGYPGDPRLSYGRDAHAEPTAAYGRGHDGPGEPTRLAYGREEPADPARLAYGREEPADPARLASGRDEPADAARLAYGRDEPAEAARMDYGRDEPAEAIRAGYGRDELAEARQAAYAREAMARAGQGGYGRDPHAEAGGGYGPDAFSEGPYPGYRPDPQADLRRAAHGREDPAGPMAAGFGQERFVPPYVQSPASEYGNDIPTRAADIPPSSRHAAYRDERADGRSAPGEYEETQWTPADYSDEPRYRLPADDGTAPRRVRPIYDDDPDAYEHGWRDRSDPGAWR